MNSFQLFISICKFFTIYQCITIRKWIYWLDVRNAPKNSRKFNVFMRTCCTIILFRIVYLIVNGMILVNIHRFEVFDIRIKLSNTSWKSKWLDLVGAFVIYLILFCPQELGNTFLNHSLLLATIHIVDSSSASRSSPGKAVQQICGACTSCIR